LKNRDNHNLSGGTDTEISGILTVLAAILPKTVGCEEQIEVPPGSGSIDGIDYVSVRDEPHHRLLITADTI